MGDPGCEEVDAAITAADVALSAIRRMTASQARLEAAGKLVAGLRLRSDEAARIRHAEAVRIYEAESLSLAQLANRVGVSKARADQIIRVEKQRQKEDGDA
jgi:hypothetical protein